MNKISEAPSRLFRILSVCAICFVAMTALGVGTGIVSAQETSINATVGEDRLVDGGEITVLEDPTVSVTASSDTPLDLIEIRIDGEIRHSYSPNETEFERDIDLNLDPNENTVEVIARSERVRSIKTTIIKNTAAPKVRYTSPFSTSVNDAPSNKTNISTGQVTLSGNLHTISEVKQIWIERTHISEEADDGAQVDRKLYRITDPGGSFSQELLLGNGTNKIVAEYTDTNGRTNVDRFQLIVDDATDPTVDLSFPNKSYTDSVRIRGTTKDETKLKKVELNRTSNNASQVLLLSSNDEPDPDMLSYSIDTTIELYENNNKNQFQLTVEDSAGNVQNRTFRVEYDPAPKIEITKNITNTTENTVQIAGKVSEARINRITLETIDTQSGERLDITRIYDAGTPTTVVEFNQTLKAIPEGTVANLLIEYKYGQEVRTITPRADLEQKTAENEVKNNSSSSNNTISSERSNKTAVGYEQNTSLSNADETTNTTPSERESSTITSSLPSTFIPIRTRDAFASVVLVGAIYLAGHWI